MPSMSEAQSIPIPRVLAVAILHSRACAAVPDTMHHADAPAVPALLQACKLASEEAYWQLAPSVRVEMLAALCYHTLNCHLVR